MIMAKERVNYRCPATRRLLLADFRQLSSHLSIGNFKGGQTTDVHMWTFWEDFPLVGYPQSDPDGPFVHGLAGMSTLLFHP